MRIVPLCMLFASILAVFFIGLGPRETKAADRALIALKKAAGIALLLQRKRFRIIPIPLPLPLPLPIPIELKNHKSWPSWPQHHQSWPQHHQSWPTISHSWSTPHVVDSWSGGSSWGGDSWGGDSWGAASGDSYGSVGSSYGGDSGY